MSFLKDTDYSGSRKYEPDSSNPRGAFNFGLTWSLTVAWAALKLRKFARLALAAVEPTPRADRGFTLLGAEQRSISRHRPISDLFPVNENVSKIRHEN
jgi:hypothetical protein